MKITIKTKDVTVCYNSLGYSEKITGFQWNDATQRVYELIKRLSDEAERQQRLIFEHKNITKNESTNNLAPDNAGLPFDKCPKQE